MIGAPESTGVIDRNGQWIEPPGTRIFDPDQRSIRIVSREILRPGPKETLSGLQRSDGSWLVKPQFDRVNPFGNGFARVRKDGKTGFIDRDGQVVIPLVFDEAWPFAPGSDRTAARQARTVGAIDRTGAWIFQMEARGIRPAISSDGGMLYGWHFERREKWGLLDLDGHVLLDADFDQPVQRCADGHLVIVKGSQWLYFKSDGIPLQPPQDGQILGSGCASPPPYVVKAGEKYGLMDGDGKQITPLEFDALVAVTSEIWNAKRDGKWGRIGLDGHWLIEPKFENLSRGNPVIIATKNAKRGFLKADESWLIEPRFDAARLLDSETAFVTTDGATGVISLRDQTWIVAPRRATMCEIPYAVLSQSEGHRAIFSRKGQTWIESNVDRLGIDLEAGLLPFSKDGKWGLMDTAGKIAIQPIYDEQVSFRPTLYGIAWIKRDGRACPIDRHGQDIPGMACIEKSRSNESGGYLRCAIE
ncbi:WG repeat-containing protein [Bradyrhizobium sp. BR 10261]|uniref:WG repeat-containing protein n=1 Tax=Bradyrhizobium sp. BR 10261 TaxID=2749992 RepID=UPI0028A1BD5E|nr:WG repeat-containing protein [Bradyrhizobium sp. BR 10261]